MLDYSRSGVKMKVEKPERSEGIIMKERLLNGRAARVIVLAAAGIWMTLLAIIGLAVIAETMNILHEMA